MSSLLQPLQQLQQQHRYRSRRIIDGYQTGSIQLNGTLLSNFSSNDYLGLSQHPQVIAAMQQGAKTYGAGSGASHLITGHSREHHLLEQELAEFVQQPRALLFSTGYMANLALLTTLGTKSATIFADKLNHASLIDAGQLARAEVLRYRHNDMKQLQSMLTKDSSQTQLLVTDSVFSMDGDIAPLPQITAMLQTNRWLIVDDAHAIGVLGSGRGSLQHYQIPPSPQHIVMGTLGKAVGVFGAFVAASEEVIETLIQFGRSYIFTTALPAAIAAATRASIRIFDNEPQHLQQLQQNIAYWRSCAKQMAIPVCDSITPIQPIITGSDRRTVAISNYLQQQQLLVSAIRPPTVAEGSSRLRITLSAAHSHSQIDQLVTALHHALHLHPPA